MRLLWDVLSLACVASALVENPTGLVGSAIHLPEGTPQPAPSYAKDNVNNKLESAPVEGLFTGPVINSLDENTLQKLHHQQSGLLKISKNATVLSAGPKLVDDTYWLSNLGPLGQSPFAPEGYQFFRDVREFGAVGDGITDDTAAINRAASAMSSKNVDEDRCREDCGSTTTLSALVYFPPGTYLISSPVVQYYHTQFVGNPVERPVIRGASNFTGIALFDSNVYIPDGAGKQWYINQSNFLRQIRNFVFDMTGMAPENYENDQRFVPTGIHWQVGQGTSISNCDFQMAPSTEASAATAMGILMENGSGGVASDLTFSGGNIGFFAGSQQFTAVNLHFSGCLTAIKHNWNWGFLWKNLYVESCYIAIDCTEYSDVTSQGTGSISVIDSHFNNVPYAITLGSESTHWPSIVIDNLSTENCESIVLVSESETILAGSAGGVNFGSWASGYQYLPKLSDEGTKIHGYMDPPLTRPEELLDEQLKFLVRSKPLYDDVEVENIVVVTDHDVANDATGDQTEAINSVLADNVGSVIYFPAGIYLVKGTVFIPVGSRIAGSGWSQIMGTGDFFGDPASPQVMVKVGEEGDSGDLEISDMLFTVQGATAGCILMEWNVHEGTPGSAAMWDSHFRVGGAEGSNLQLDDCGLASGFTQSTRWSGSSES